MAALSSPTASPPSPRPTRPPIATMESTDRHDLVQQAGDFDRQARQAAEMGDLATAARLILQSLDCERRAGGLGPQVLQLIKPR